MEKNTSHKEILAEALSKLMGEAKVPYKIHLKVIEELKKAIENHKNDVSLMHKNHKEQISGFETLLNQYQSEIERRKIEKGEPGKDVSPIDEKAIERRIKASIRVPEDGKTPIIDEKKIALLVLGMLPEQEKIKEFDKEDFTKELIKYIQKNKVIDVSHIRNSEQFLYKGTKYGIAEMMHGAGSSTGGGGFTTLVPSETPNGSRTTFTFLTATAQPTFIISDNAQMQAVTKAGTVNWSWNNGTKVATMTIPPVDDIIGIA